MLTLLPNTKAFICAAPVDMRSSFDSLSGMIKSSLVQNPLSGDVFVFLSRRRDRMKVLLWELDGYVLYYKRLETGTFSWVQDLDLTKTCEISAVEFQLLLSSVNIKYDSRRFRSHTQKNPALRLV